MGRYYAVWDDIMVCGVLCVVCDMRCVVRSVGGRWCMMCRPLGPRGLRWALWGSSGPSGGCSWASLGPLGLLWARSALQIIICCTSGLRTALARIWRPGPWPKLCSKCFKQYSFRALLASGRPWPGSGGPVPGRNCARSGFKKCSFGALLASGRPWPESGGPAPGRNCVRSA